MLTLYHSASRLGEIVAPLFVAVCTAYLGLTWRGVFLVMSAFCFVVTIAALGLRDPGFGRFDSERVRAAVRESAGTGSLGPSESHGLGFFEIIQRLMLIPTVRSLLFAEAALGMMLIPLNTYVFFYMQERWGLGPAGRSIVFAVLPIFSLVALLAYTRGGERLFRIDQPRFLRIAGALRSRPPVSPSWRSFTHPRYGSS